MNILLQTLLLLGGINLIAAFYVNWASARSFQEDLFGSPYMPYDDDVGDYRRFHKFFDDYSEEDVSKETTDKLDRKHRKEFEILLRTILSGHDDDNVDERKITDATKEITNEKDADDKSDNDDDSDDKNENNDNDKSDNDDNKNDNDDDDNNDANDDKNEKDARDKSDNDDDKNDNDDNVNNDDNDDNDTKEDKEELVEIIDNSNEEIPVKPIVIADELLFLGKSSEESNETLTVNQDDNVDDDTEHVKTSPVENEELSEKEIRELTAFLVTLSAMEDLLKVAEHIKDEDNSQDAEELFEQKLKEVDNFMGLFVNTLDAILEDTSEVEKDTEKSKNDDDNDSDNDKDDKDDSKDDNDNENDDNDDDDDKKEASVENNNNEDASASVEFHSVDSQLNTQNMDTHKYNLVERSTTTAQDFKPTSSPYTPELYSSAGNPNVAIMHEYVEEREQLDELQENLLTNKLNMDRDFYHIFANEDNDKNLQKFGDDIAAMRENIFKMKQTIDAMQDIKSKLYFHQLIKTALKDAQIN